MNKKYRKYQRQAIRFLNEHRNTIVCAPIGTGKTLVALGHIHHLLTKSHQVENALIVCPKANKLRWAEETAKWFGNDLKTQIIEGTPKQRIAQWNADANVFIVNYELLREARIVPAWIMHKYVLVADEICRLKTGRKIIWLRNLTTKPGYDYFVGLSSRRLNGSLEVEQMFSMRMDLFHLFRPLESI